MHLNGIFPFKPSINRGTRTPFLEPPNAYLFICRSQLEATGSVLQVQGNLELAPRRELLRKEGRDTWQNGRCLVPVGEPGWLVLCGHPSQTMDIKSVTILA